MRTYSGSFAKEARICRKALKLGYSSREEMAHTLGIEYTVNAILDVSGKSEPQITRALSEEKTNKQGSKNYAIRN